MPFTIDFSGKTIIVTGGNRGIGHAISEAVAAAGANTAIIYHSSPDAPKIAEDLGKKYNVKCKAYKCDVTDSNLTKKTFAEIESELGQVTGLVANAGIALPKPALEITIEDFNKQMQGNVWGCFASSQAIASIWKERGFKKGSIVIISSMSSQIQNKGITQVFYNASKAAASNVVKQLAGEWAPLGIRVNAVSPGVTETDQTKDQSAEHKKETNDMVPLGRYAHPQEMTGQTLLFLSEHSTYQTGSEVFVDGGFLIW